jgi:hypothetical protein
MATKEVVIEIDAHGGKATVTIPRPEDGMPVIVIKQVGDGEESIEAPYAKLPIDTD